MAKGQATTRANEFATAAANQGAPPDNVHNQRKKLPCKPWMGKRKASMTKARAKVRVRTKVDTEGYITMADATMVGTTAAEQAQRKTKNSGNKIGLATEGATVPSHGGRRPSSDIPAHTEQTAPSTPTKAEPPPKRPGDGVVTRQNQMQSQEEVNLV